MRQEAGYELLEHTADVGVRARGGTLEELFEQATLGVAEVLGAWRPGAGRTVALTVEAADLGALLVDWLNEVLYLREVRYGSLGAVTVERVAAERATGSVALTSGEPSGGTYVKAATYHGLRVERSGGGWLAEVYLDV